MKHPLLYAPMLFTIGEECRHVRHHVGINEIHNFSKFLVTGSKAREWLDGIMYGRIPTVGHSEPITALES